MAIPKLPKTTRIAGERWRVVPRRQVRFEGEDLEGVCHFDSHRIEVTIESEDEYTILQNYWHEIAHAIFHMSGQQDISDDAAHAVIAVLERYLAANVDIREKVRKPKHKKVT